MKTKPRPASSRPGKNGHSKTPKRITKSAISRNGDGKNGHGKNGKPHSNGVSAYSKALRFLSTLTDHERLRIVRYNSSNFDLNRMRHLLKKLGNPQDEFKSVHVAGTKGKGSTCHMTAAMLQACGHKVGLYTSPHLVDIRERIQINGEMVPHADFARLIKWSRRMSTG